LGLPLRPDYLEIEQLKLTNEHFPLPCSLRELVVQRYADPESPALGMDLDEVLGYLRNVEDLALTPMQSITAQTELIGNPALPNVEQTAILLWLGTAFDDWERHYALDQALSLELRRLKPLAASLAITDPDFLLPGQHPLHQILDALQLAAVGWQTSLGRTGQALQKHVGGAVEGALAWFDNRETDLASECSQVVKAIERDQARANRMAQRMIETEQGRIKTAEAKRVAADMINTALEEYRVPGTIGKFLKGPWYESAQLVLLKFGAESEQWEQMSATTSTLLDSVQFTEGEEAPERRKQVFEVVTQLPKEMKRWLLSLQHDGDSVENALDTVEYAHMQILRKEPLELEKINPLPVTTTSAVEVTENALASIETGQWFSVDLGEGEPTRMRLVLRIENARELLFANLAGIKVLQASFEEFSTLIESQKVIALDSGASFSRSLAGAGGINNTDDLDAILGPAILQARREEEERQRLAEENERREQEQTERLVRERAEAERVQQERAEVARRAQDQEEAKRLEQEQAEADALQQEWDHAQRKQQARQEAKRLAESPEPTTPGQTRDSVPPVKPDVPVEPAPEPEMQENAVAKPALPMGIWLGFHDGDTPLLAKLAVHDRENNNYIFVNRSGMKMRQLNQAELLALIEEGLVDILEAQTSFRDEISRVKQESED
jgi:hypothetical protein